MLDQPSILLRPPWLKKRQSGKSSVLSGAFCYGVKIYETRNEWRSQMAVRRFWLPPVPGKAINKPLGVSTGFLSPTLLAVVVAAGV